MPPRRPPGQLFGEDHRHAVVLPTPAKKDPKAEAAKKRMQEKAKPKPKAQPVSPRMPDWLTQPAVSLKPPPKPPPHTPKGGMVRYSEKHKGTPIDVGGLLAGVGERAAHIAINKAEAGWQMTPPGKAMQALGKVAEEAPRLRPSVSAAHVIVPHEFVPAEARAASKGKPVYADEFGPGKKYGEFVLGAERRAKFAPLIKANGYPIQDMPTWNDAGVFARAFGPKYEHSISGFLRNFAADTGEQGALVNVPRLVEDAVAQSIGERSGMPVAHVAQDLLEGFRKPAPFIGDRPWLENLYGRPLTTALTVAPVIKGGLRVGPGRFIKPTREITPPSAQRAAAHAGEEAEPLTVPATKHPIGRTGQAIHDYFLHHGNPDTEGMNPVAAARAKIGNKADERHQQRTMNQAREVSRLKKGADPHIAILDYADAIQNVPRWAPLIKGKKQARLIEAIIRSHMAFASHSDQAAEAFESFARKSDNAANQHEVDILHAQAELEKLTPKTREHDRKQAEITASRHAAEEQRGHAERQRAKAAELREFTIDPLNPEKGHGELAATGRTAARQQTQFLRDAGFIDDKGVLYGDWQHRMTIVRETEGPGSDRAIAAGHGETGTPGFQIAETVQSPGGLRDQFNELRDKVHGRTAGDDTEIPASADIRSPEAQHQFGRARRANRLFQSLSGAMYELGQRQRERAQRLPAEHAGHPHGPVAHAIAQAEAAGIAPQVVTRAVDKAVDALGSTRKAKGDRARRISDSADQLEQQERAAHHENTQDEITRLEQAIRTAELAHAPQSKIIELNRLLREAQRSQTDGFKPSEKLLMRRSRAEREGFLSRMHELTPGEINRHIDKHFTPDEIEAIGRPVIEDAIRHGLDQRSGFGNLHVDIGKSAREAGAAFEEAAGHPIEDALALDTLKARYSHGLRSFEKDQRELGYDAAHGRLHAPDETFGLQPTTVTGGEQFRTGNFDGNMHVFVASDLKGLANKAAEGQMYEQLAEGPFVLEHPVQGEPVPKGFYAIERGAWENLQQASRNGEQLDTLVAALGDKGPTHVPFDGGETVLITEVMRRHIIDLIKRGNPKELNLYLRGMNSYRRWMLFTLPRTWVANAVGNPILASLQGGAIFRWRESVWTLRNHPERVPHTMRTRGIGGNVGGARGARGMFGPQAFWRHQNTFQEDNGNLMVYLMHAKRAFKKMTRESPDMKSLHWFNRVSRFNEHWGEFLEKAARGENPDSAAWSAKSAEMFGEMNKVFKYDSFLSGSILFHRWVGHMIFLTMWTMPVRYTGRTLFLQQTAILADQYRKEHGLFPEWAQEMMPLWDEVDTVLGGQLQHVTWALSGGNWNPLATYGQTFDLGDETRAKAPLQSAIANNITPPLRIAAEQLWLGRRLDTGQPFQDEWGEEIKGFDWHVGANSVIANWPVISTIFPRPGLADNTVQIPGLFPQNERYSKASGVDKSMAPSRAFRDRTWWQEVLLRIGAASGGTLRPIDGPGPRTRDAALRTRDFQQLEKTKRENKNAEILRAKIKAMSPEDQRAWYRANKPELYDREFPNG